MLSLFSKKKIETSPFAKKTEKITLTPFPPYNGAYYSSNPEEMPVWVGIFYWVVPTIGVAVQRLRIIRRLNYGIGLSEPSKSWVIVSGSVVAETGGVQF